MGGVVCGQEVTLDFTTNNWGLPTSGGKSSTEYSNGTYTITVQAANEYKYNKSYLFIGKTGSSITLQKFDFDVEKIVVVGKSGASTSTLQNIFVDDIAVSTQTKGSAGTNTYTISSDYQAAGNIYTLKILSNQNAQITKILIYKKQEADNRQETTLSFDEETVNKTIGDADFTKTATLSHAIDGAEITYSSDNETVAKVNATTGTVTLGQTKGTAKITATYKGNDEYKGSTASYTINLIKPQVVVDGYFDFTSPELYGKGESSGTDNHDGDLAVGESIKAGNVTLTVTKANKTNPTRFWKDGLRTYTGAQHKLSVPNGYIITNVDIALTKGKATVGDLNKQEVTIDYSKDGNDSPVLTSITVEYTAGFTTAASSFATYACDYAVDYSAIDGLKAYAIELDEDNGTVKYNEISGTVTAKTPVLVKGEASTSYAMIPSTADATTVTTALKISDGNVVTEGKLYYGFATINGVSGFKLVNDGITIPAKKGYLKLSAPMSNAKTFYAFDGGATGIEETFTENEAAKAYAPMYNISGQRVGEGYKGIVIVNGKKYMK